MIHSLIFLALLIGGYWQLVDNLSGQTANAAMNGAFLLCLAFAWLGWSLCSCWRDWIDDFENPYDIPDDDTLE